MKRRARDLGLGSLVVSIVLVASCGFDPIDLAGRDCPCVGGWVCDTTTNRCVRPGDVTPVVNGNDGGGGGGVGDASAGCTLSPDSCPTGRYCLETGECAPGCKVNGDCADSDAGAGLCNLTRHQCVECLVPGDCPAGKLCSPSGKCVEGCDPAAGKNCTAGSCCSNLCVNPTNDLFNCGGCNVACSGGDTLCCASSCANPLTSATHCGGCGNACSTANGTPSCSAGACKWTCNAGFSHCQSGNTGCETNTGTDPAHCGNCSTVCANVVKNASGITCTGGGCTFSTCSAGFGNCDSNAANGCETNVTTDVLHCGNCATNCNTQVQHASGITCGSGTCDYTACAAGYGDCDGVRSNGCECVCGGNNQQCCPVAPKCVPGKACETSTNLCK